MTGMDDAFCSSTRPRRSMHRARADRVGHRAPEASYWASSRPIVGLSKRQSTCSRDLYHPHGPSGWSSWLRRGRPMRLARRSPNFREEFLSETQRTRGHEESRGCVRPRLSSLWSRGRLRGCPAALIPTVGSHGRRSVALLPLTLVYASNHFPNMATPPLSLRSLSECPDDKGLRHREACLPDDTHSVRGGLSLIWDDHASKVLSTSV